MFITLHGFVKRNYLILIFACTICASMLGCADIREDLENLRDRCLYYSIGYAPNDINSVTIRHGLYAQSPFSIPDTEIDIAASGFSLAALPSAVENGLISRYEADIIAINASRRILDMVANSASASNLQEYNKYGFKGMLYHYYLWSESDNEFQGKNNVEISSIDTALLMMGLLVCGNYFNGEVLNNYQTVKDLIRWNDWIDATTPGHINQFRMSYKNGAFLDNWWDWRSEETMLICLVAAMSDSNLDIRVLWDAWNKSLVTYNSPAPDSKSFTCYATWNGDPFTVFYGLQFVKFRPDINGIDWFIEGKTAYSGHVEFFKKEKGYLDHMTFSYSCGSEGAIAEPKCSTDTPITRQDCPIYSLAGGLDYYHKDPLSNPLANTISLLVQKDNFFEWTGWPPESVNAVSASHENYNGAIIGQNIASIAISIDNYLSNRIRNIVMEDNDFKRVYEILMPVY